MVRMSVPLTIEEREALISLALKERRDPRDQAAVAIREVLERAGYLRPMTQRNEVQYAA